MPPYFPDSTEEIIVRVLADDASLNKRIWIEIELNKDKDFSNLLINYMSDNPRPTVIGLYDGIKNIIEPKKNKNKIFHLYTIIDFLLLVFIILSGIQSKSVSRERSLPSASYFL